MRIESKGLQNAFKKLPRKKRKNLGDVIRKSVFEGVSLARVMAPVGKGPRDPDVGRFKDGIHAKFDLTKHAFVGSVEAAAPTRDAQANALSIEFGRQCKGGKRRQPPSGDARNTGTTDPVPVIRRTQSIIGPKHVSRVRRAMNKAAKELGLKN